MSNAIPAKSYEMGDEANTKWGYWKVIGKDPDGLTWIKKHIRVDPANVLSLQSHDQRKELWEVREGTLTIILDGELKTLNAGDSIRIPLGSVHTMANLSGAPVVVEELQEGHCDENDIHRFADMYDRPAEQSNDSNVVNSLPIFKGILEEIQSFATKVQRSKLSL